METGFENAYEEVKVLVKLFDEHKQHYLSPGYSEIDARRDFIDRLFIALGWDVKHDIHKNPYEQEVKVEKNVNMGRTQRKADYAFYLAPNYRDVKFYVEAKKPYVDIEKRDYYFQTIRYGWNSQTPLAVLTDFEQFHILDCRYKPNIDTALEFCSKKYYYKDYADRDKFSEIYYLFARVAVAGNSLDKYAEALPKKRGKAIQKSLFKGGYQPIDEAFLMQLDDYRDTLARILKNRNPELNGRILTEITHRILDRLVFLRFLEDKLIETNLSVAKFGDKGSTWGDFLAASRRLDSIYNGIVFKKHSIIDSGKVIIDDKAFGDLCEELSNLNSPYNFDIIPIHILGSIYERFLGKVIVTTANRAHVEEKPEIKKAGGVYYTPEYIVRYIVENTVGKLIKGKSPNQIAEMKFADIACGSGSFLLGIYDTLLKYHREWYNNKPSRIKRGDCVRHEDGTYHLTLSEKRRILLNNVYGVDIDPQAVEVAQLSLYLKLLEEETTATSRDYQLEFHETLLPSLMKNIKCGNSLVGPDFYRQKNLSLLDLEEQYRTNVFDWQSEFSSIMKAGGFDVVIGNPPYFNINTLDKDIYYYLESNYKDIHTGYNDIMYYFVFKSIELLNNNGVFGAITSNYYLGNEYAKPLRRYISKYIRKILNFKEYKVFANANVHTNIIIAEKSPPNVIDYLEVKGDLINKDDLEQNFTSFKLKRNDLNDEWVLATDENLTLINKIRQNHAMLGELTTIEKGPSSGNNIIFTVSSNFAKENNFEKELLRKNIKNADIERYYLGDRKNYLIYIDNKTNIKSYPNIYKYLKSHKRELSQRNEVKKGLYMWYRLERPRRKEIFDAREKIVVPYRAEENRFAFDDRQHFNDGGDIRAITIEKGIKLNIRFVLGILNSKLMNWFYGFIGKPKGKSREYFNKPMSQIPIRTIDFDDPKDVIKHERIVSLVNQMIELKNKLIKAKTDHEKNTLARQIDYTDNQIDALVYDLYDLTEHEVKIVEQTR